MKRTPLKRGTSQLKRTPFKRKVKKWKIKASEKLHTIKPRIWSLKRADDEFSLYIRNRDGRCMYPNCTVTDIKKLQCSHYYGRTHKATRFDPDNCIALCWLHHFKDKMVGWEYAKQTVQDQGFDGKYTQFMRSWLGQSKFTELYLRAHSTKPQSDAIIDCMKLLHAI